MMQGLELFTMGSWVIALAYFTSAIGVFVGVTSARKVRLASTNRMRMYWLVVASLVIGGVGVWLAQFLPMAGFTVDDSVARYDLVTIIFSMTVALVLVFVALLVAMPSYGGGSAGRVVAGAVVLGIGLAVVPYAIMWSVRIQGTISFDPVFVGASTVLAFVTAIGFMWQVLRADTWMKRFVSSALTGASVVGVHFLGAASLGVTLDSAVAVPNGIEVFSILFPLFVVGLLLLAVPIVAVLLAPDRVAVELEREADNWGADVSRSSDR